MNDLPYLPATEALRLFRSRELSAAGGLMTGAPPVPPGVPGHARELAGPAVQPVGVPACPRADPDGADLPR